MVSENGMGMPAIVGDATGGKVCNIQALRTLLILNKGSIRMTLFKYAIRLLL